MKCPACDFKETKVVDSRICGDGESIRRRRECLGCEQRFTTYEYVERVPLMIIKKDDRREAFDRAKVFNGLLKACEKRPISITRLEELAAEIEQAILNTNEREIRSDLIGEIVMEKLAALDEVAYVRFASVYRQFRDVNHFMNELKLILEKDKVSEKAGH